MNQSSLSPTHTQQKRLKSALFLLLPLSLLSLQFYIFPSGVPQLSHILGLLFSLVVVAKYSFFSTVKHKPIALFTLYTGYTIVVNLVYFLIENDTSFLMNVVYNIFNYLSFTALVKFMVIRGDLLSRFVRFPILISLLITVGLYFSGLGRYDFAPRYNAFFNDPNQMAHWALCCVAVICLIGVKTKWLLVALGALLVICAASSSRSALLGLGPVLLGSLIHVRANLKRIPSIAKWGFYGLFILILMVGAYWLVESRFWENLEAVSFILERAASTNTAEQLEGRGYNLVYNFPEYLFFGAGQGSFERFSTDAEIHSNWVGILFYYGIIGLVLFLSSLYTMVKRLPWYLILVAMGPLLYGFTTYGLRTPVFYFYFAAVFYVYYRELRSKQKNKYQRQENETF